MREGVRRGRSLGVVRSGLRRCSRLVGGGARWRGGWGWGGVRKWVRGRMRRIVGGCKGMGWGGLEADEGRLRVVVVVVVGRGWGR